MNDRPYIVVNARISPERIRFTIVYELTRLMFIWSETMSNKEVDKKAKAISSAFWITKDITLIAPKHPSLFKQLVCRAVKEQEISVQRGAELLQQPHSEVTGMYGANTGGDDL